MFNSDICTKKNLSIFTISLLLFTGGGYVYYRYKKPKNDPIT